jgi:hypothetical protein
MNIAPLDSLIDFKFIFKEKNTKQIMKTIDYIPTSKLKEPQNLYKQAKVGVNFKYYGEKIEFRLKHVIN